MKYPFAKIRMGFELKRQRRLNSRVTIFIFADTTILQATVKAERNRGRPAKYPKTQNMNNTSWIWRRRTTVYW